MYLKALAQESDTQEVVNIIKSVYKGTTIPDETFIDILNKLRSVDAVINKDNPLLCLVYTEPGIGPDEPSRESVAAFSDKENQLYDCLFLTIGEWAGLKVSEPSRLHYGNNTFMAHVIWNIALLEEAEQDEDSVKRFIDSLSMFRHFKNTSDDSSDIDVPAKEITYAEEAIEKGNQNARDMIGR